MVFKLFSIFCHYTFRQGHLSVSTELIKRFGELIIRFAELFISFGRPHYPLQQGSLSFSANSIILFGRTYYPIRAELIIHFGNLVIRFGILSYHHLNRNNSGSSNKNRLIHKRCKSKIRQDEC